MLLLSYLFNTLSVFKTPLKMKRVNDDRAWAWIKQLGVLRRKQLRRTISLKQYGLRLPTLLMSKGVASLGGATV